MKRFLSVAVLLLAGCGDAPERATALRLTFDPPDSLTYRAEVVSVRMRIFEGDTTVDSSWSATTHTLTADGGGCLIRSHTDSVRVSRDGQPVSDRFVTLFSQGEFVHVIDSSGRAVDVRGYDELFQQLDSLLGPDTAAAVRQNVSPAALREKELRDWNSRLARFGGQDLYIARPLFDSGSIYLPTGGSVRTFEIAELVDTMRMGTVLCARIRLLAHSDPAQLAELAGRKVAEVADSLHLSDSTVAAFSAAQIGSSMVSEWVVEVPTMLTRSFDATRELYVETTGADGKPTRGRMIEIQSKQYLYP